MKNKEMAQNIRFMVKTLNETVFDNMFSADNFEVRTKKNFVCGFAVGMCEWKNEQQKFRLTFSRVIPSHWVKDWDSRIWALVAHEMAHAAQFVLGDFDTVENCHKAKSFRKYGKKFSRVTGIPVKYFGMSGEIK